MIVDRQTHTQTDTLITILLGGGVTMHDIASQQTESSALLPPALRQTQAAVSVVLSGAIYWVIPALHPPGGAISSTSFAGGKGGNVNSAGVIP